MARQEGRRWVADGIDPQGKRRRFTFPTQERAEDYEKRVLNGSHQYSIGHLFPKWLDECWPPNESRDPSVEGRVTDIITTLGKDVHIRSIDDDMITDLKAKLAAKGNKINTVANKLNALSKLLRYAVKKKVIPYRPDFTVSRDKNANRTFVLTPEQEDALLTALPDRWRPFAIFLIDTASRGFKECKALRWQDVDFAGRAVSFWYNKTDHPRSVKLTEDALAVLRAMQEAGWGRPWAILDTEGMSYRMWNTYWGKARDAAGLPKGEVVAYSCRHTTATRHARNGMDVLKLADLLGHSNLATTRRYVHQNVEVQAEFVKKIERTRNIKTV